ncbi:DUF6461 domain-containing protein [Streptomyces sp. CWNU-1]|uniref:DUF6461 domain-containing protein n=2 Tax=Streptomyces albipurpureus TaxID=2897419 RepID=A0ABT0UGG3_9ACTN|nr:DUF6461 domain-containing protein [Streptomyces sp. CWNU-1]
MESGYTLTLIRGRTPREVLRAMEAEPRGTGEGTAGLIEADEAHRDEPETADLEGMGSTFPKRTDAPPPAPLP